MTLKNDWSNGDEFAPGDVNSIADAVNASEVAANKGEPGGYASLDANGTVPIGQIPAIGVSSIDATGTPDSSTFLCGDGSWSAPAGGGGGGGRQVIALTAPLTTLPADPGAEYFITLGRSSATTQCLMHFDTEHTQQQLINNAGFPDESGRIWGGNVTWDNTVSKFGVGSAQFLGWGSSSLFPNGSNTTKWGSGELTIECWIKPSSLEGIVFDATQGLSVSLGGGGEIYGPGISSGSGVIVVDQWQHIALTRTSGEFRLFVNGVSQGSAMNNTYYSATWEAPRFGSAHAAAWQKDTWSFFYGHMDEIRICKESKYYADFTPQTSQHTDSWGSRVYLPSPAGNTSYYSLIPAITDDPETYTYPLVFFASQADIASPDSTIKQSNTLTANGLEFGNGWDGNWSGNTPIAKLIGSNSILQWRIFSDGTQWLSYYQ